MAQSETIGKLADALAKAQGQITNASRDKENPFFKSKYADLASVWAACREPLSMNGLSVVQTTEVSDAVILTTRLLHASGEWISGELSVLPSKKDPQGIGSAITYLRRYGLAAIVGVATEDDDAESATVHSAPAGLKAVTVTHPPASETYHGITNAQAQRIFALGDARATELRIASKRAGESIVRQVYEAMGIANTSAIPLDRYDDVCAAVASWGNEVAS